MLRLERDAWSMVTRLRQTANEYEYAPTIVAVAGVLIVTFCRRLFPLKSQKISCLKASEYSCLSASTHFYTMPSNKRTWILSRQAMFVPGTLRRQKKHTALVFIPLSSPFRSLSLLVVTQIRGHIAGSSPPSPLLFAP